MSMPSLIVVLLINCSFCITGCRWLLQNHLAGYCVILGDTVVTSVYNLFEEAIPEKSADYSESSGDMLKNVSSLGKITWST